MVGTVLPRSPESRDTLRESWPCRIASNAEGMSLAAPQAIVPISIFIFGLGPQLYLFIIAFSALWPIYINAANALSAPEPVQVASAASMGYNDREILLRVRLPAAMPEIFTGIRLGAGIALGAVASEMLAAGSGTSSSRHIRATWTLPIPQRT